MRATVVAIVGVLTASSAARADVWNNEDNLVAGNPSGAVSYGGGTFYAVNNTLVARGSDGTIYGRRDVGGVIQGFPSAVPLADGITWLFSSSEDGYVHKVDAGDMLEKGTRQVWRSGICADDGLAATPTVQLKAYSTGWTQPADLVYIPTYHGCGEQTTNQIIAVPASNISATPVWTFNLGDYEVDYFSEGCSLDYERNRLYCGSHLAAGNYQNTVWAINTNDGSLAWAGNYNSVHARPQLGHSNNHLYVADQLGNLHAIDRDTGAESWSIPLVVTPGVYLEGNMWAEFRDPYKDMLFITDSVGTVHAVYDSGAYPGGGIEVWTSTASYGVYIGIAAVSPTLGKMYLSSTHGHVHQLDMSNGSWEAHRDIGPKAGWAGQLVTDPALQVAGGVDIDRMVVSVNTGTTSVSKQFTVPFGLGTTGNAPQVCTQDSDCSDRNTPTGCAVSGASNRCCSVGACGPGGVCYTKPQTLAAGESCSDGNRSSCTKAQTCHAGACWGTWDTSKCPQDGQATNCAKDPARACGTGKVCEKLGATSWACRDLMSVDYCGGLSRSCAVSTRNGAVPWGGERACNRGMCERNTSTCGSLVSAAAIQSASADASGLSIERVAGGECSAFVTSIATSSNRVRKVRPSGGTWDGGSGTLTLNGSAVHVNGTTTTVFVSIQNSQRNAGGPWPGWLVTVNNVPDVVRELDLGGSNPPIATTCTANCPFTTSTYNSGFSPPAVDANREPYYGNYRANGDLWFLDGTSFVPTRAWTWTFMAPAAPPWCPDISLGGCKESDRITSLDFGPDGILRIGHKAQVIFYNTTTKTVVKTVNINTGWYGASSYDFRWVTSVSVDTLNLAGNTIVEARDSLGNQHILVISPDYSVRFHSDMQKDLWDAKWPPPLVTPDASTGPLAINDGRMSAKAQDKLFRLTPTTTPNSGGTATVRRLTMPR